MRNRQKHKISNYKKLKEKRNIAYGNKYALSIYKEFVKSKNIKFTEVTEESYDGVKAKITFYDEYPRYF